MLPLDSNSTNTYGDGTTNEPYTTLFVLLLFGLTIILLAVLIRQCGCIVSRGTEQNTSTRAAGSSQAETETRLDRERRRRDYIKKVLVSHPWSGSSSGRIDTAFTRDDEIHVSIPKGFEDDDNRDDMSEKVDAEQQPASFASDEESQQSATCDLQRRNEEGPDCAICLSSFAESEIVCESNNPRCRHMFHRECMEPWLLHHEQCPVCREPYLQATLFLTVRKCRAFSVSAVSSRHDNHSQRHQLHHHHHHDLHRPITSSQFFITI